MALCRHLPTLSFFTETVCSFLAAKPVDLLILSSGDGDLVDRSASLALNYRYGHILDASLLRGRFLRNERPVEDERSSSVAASELVQLRQRHTVSGLRYVLFEASVLLIVPNATNQEDKYLHRSEVLAKDQCDLVEKFLVMCKGWGVLGGAGRGMLYFGACNNCKPDAIDEEKRKEDERNIVCMSTCEIGAGHSFPWVYAGTTPLLCLSETSVTAASMLRMETDVVWRDVDDSKGIASMKKSWSEGPTDPRDDLLLDRVNWFSPSALRR
ncbi:hypothetical protein Tco_0743838 [Tanacetum coccineum]